MRKKREYSLRQIRSCAFLYMALPLFCFFGGFLRWYFTVPCCCVLGLILRRMLREERKNYDAFSAAGKTIAVVFLAAMLWTYLGGMNGYFYQSSDWDCRNAINFDLIRYDWPVIYDRNGAALVYYIGHWLPPAVLAKLVQAVTGSVRWGRFAGRMFLWIWSSLGLTIIILMMFPFVGARTGKQRAVSVFLFVFFSGLDLIGGILTRRMDYLLAPTLLHLEWWGAFQYTSMTACVFWVFNQTIIPWMITLCVLAEDDPRNYVFYVTVCMLCGTLPCVGLAVIMLVKAGMYCAETVKRGRARGIPGRLFSAQNLLTLFVLLPFIMAFILSSNTVTALLGDKLPAFGGKEVSVLTAQAQPGNAAPRVQPLAARRDEPPLRKAAPMQAASASGEKRSFFSKGSLNYKLFGFFMIEAGFYMICILPDHRRNPLYYAIGVSLFFIPCFQVGASNDFCMRASVPGFFALMLYVNRYLLEHFPLRRRIRGRGTAETVRSLSAILLACCFAIGAATPAVEFYRGFYHVAESGTVRLEDQRRMTFNQERIPDNFACGNPEEHVFFRYLAR